jgi:hypothetical protein
MNGAYNGEEPPSTIGVNDRVKAPSTNGFLDNVATSLALYVDEVDKQGWWLVGGSAGTETHLQINTTQKTK